MAKMKIAKRNKTIVMKEGIDQRATCSMCDKWKKSTETGEDRNIGPCFLNPPQVLNVQRVEKAPDGHSLIVIPHWMNMRPQCMSNDIACKDFAPIKGE
jgi:hypothetical protein